MCTKHVSDTGPPRGLEVDVRCLAAQTVLLLCIHRKKAMSKPAKRRYHISTEISVEPVYSLMVMRQPSNKLRICMGTKPMNRPSERNHYPLSIIEDILLGYKSLLFVRSVISSGTLS